MTAAFAVASICLACLPLLSVNAEEPLAEGAIDEVEAAQSVTHSRHLYLEHCAGCHGETGDGLAKASKYLFPRPRDLRAGKFRLVSTQNSVPSRQDLHNVLLRGMPGSSMPPWAHLSLADRDALVDEIYRLVSAGARDFYSNMLREVEGLNDEDFEDEDVQEEIADYALRATTPGASSEVPKLDETNRASIERGHELYLNSGCAQCHGADGKGDSTFVMFDAEGMPTTARDFTLGIFKGADDPESLYRRIVYGMPGTPMPSSAQLKPGEVTDLVHFLRSLSTQQQREAVVLQRQMIVATRITSSIPESDEAEVWSVVPMTPLRVMPLWWRNGVEPDLTVQAVHDGEQLAVRVSWLDKSDDKQASRSESFEDAIAMQVFRGDHEPFLGMGDHASPVEIWYWDANHQTQAASYQEPYPDVVVDRYPFTEGPVTSTSIHRDGAQLANQPDLALPAKASGNRIVPGGPDSGAAALAAAGPGSVTFHIPRSRLAVAHGTWRDGRWNVVMKRPLAIAAIDGVALQPGDQVSVAFALWDGSAQDRASQKSITIWQNLKLEP